MDIKIVSNKENALMGRKEIVFTLRHEGETTPSRVQVRQLLASEVGSKTENVVIDSMESEYGRGWTSGTARAYKSADEARKTERVHLLKRNSLYVEKVKKEQPKKEA
ncbi:MAG: small subunit ribosomal protein S24e [Acidimicrobiaceae bacterium]|jgi:small subunit ribosomal protein S24e|nr:small subunit ribosomal protein S24e [Acidimicrobiaceae bacterium]